MALRRAAPRPRGQHPWRGASFFCALLAGVSIGALAGDSEPGPADVLADIWPGVRDSSEHLVASRDRGAASFGDQQVLRVRTVVSRVQVPWLGLRVLYLEEFLQDEPHVLRRQLLLRIEPDLGAGRRVRVFPYTFKNPNHWRALNRNPHLITSLRARDIEATSGCDLVLHQEGDQFRGGTTGLDCQDESGGTEMYVDYRLVIGSDVYWYRRRLLRESDDSLVEELMGYNWFEPNEARLFTCRVRWSSTGKRSDLADLARLDVHDQGGRARFTSPDGRKFELSLHSEDWPFTSDRDALILVLQQPNSLEPIASAWTDLQASQIAIDLGWMTVRCGPLVPETNEVAS
jgi:hypothetical protein